MGKKNTPDIPDPPALHKRERVSVSSRHPYKIHLRQGTISSNTIAMLRKIKCSNLKTRQNFFGTLQTTTNRERQRATLGISEAHGNRPVIWIGIILLTEQQSKKIHVHSKRNHYYIHSYIL